MSTLKALIDPCPSTVNQPTISVVAIRPAAIAFMKCVSPSEDLGDGQFCCFSLSQQTGHDSWYNPGVVDE